MKTKLELAHDAALAMIRSGCSLHTAIADAWRYADAMQAEAEKRNKEEAEQKRKEMREMLNADNTFVEREGQHFDDVCSDEIHAQRDAELYGCGFLKVTYDENGVKYERMNPEVVSICDKNIGLDSEVLKEWQPDWSKAPEWAKWWSMDDDAECYYFENKPEIKYMTWMSLDDGEVGRSPSFGYTGSWKKSLRERPE